MGKQVATLQRPTTNDPEAWKAYWEAQGQPWRTEPEIDVERQKYLTERRAIVPNIEQGIYPFKDMRLSRADVEWLLVTHENGRGPVDWNDESQRERQGLDLRGADLHGVDLRYLPLTNMLGGLNWSVSINATLEECSMAAVHMEGADLRRARLEHAVLHDAHLANTNLERAYLEEANLRWAHLDGAIFHFAFLKGAYLREASLKGADFTDAFLEKVRFVNVVLSDEDGTGPLLADAHWDDVNLALVKWSEKNVLGDEHQARQKMRDGKLKENAIRLDEYEGAVRANRQLAVALQTQGLNEISARFAYRAQKLQRVVLRRQKKFGSYFFSLFLDLLAGYGYHSGRSVIWYLVTIIGFALAYHFLGGLTLYPPDAFIFSIMSFHGRGFFPSLSSETNLHNPLVMLAAVEAIVGLLIEISFIATFTQRFFGK